MWAKVKDNPNWYKVLDVEDEGEGKQNSYLLEKIGKVQYNDLEDISFISPE